MISTNKYFLSCVAAVLLINSGNEYAVRVSNSAAARHTYASPSPQIQLSEINLAHIGHLAPKGRVQDRDYNQLSVVDQLIAHGKESIPFLISKLDDETKIEGHIVDYWDQVYVGGVALILMILSDFFLNESWERSTIKGMDWENF